MVVLLQAVRAPAFLQQRACWRTSQESGSRASKQGCLVHMWCTRWRSAEYSLRANLNVFVLVCVASWCAPLNIALSSWKAAVVPTVADGAQRCSARGRRRMVRLLRQRVRAWRAPTRWQTRRQSSACRGLSRASWRSKAAPRCSRNRRLPVTAQQARLRLQTLAPQYLLAAIVKVCASRGY